MADATDTPPLPEVVWHEFSRTVTVQAYRVTEAGHRVITIDGLQTPGPDNYVVNEAGIVSIVDAETFDALYGVTEEPVVKK